MCIQSNGTFVPIISNLTDKLQEITMQLGLPSRHFLNFALSMFNRIDIIRVKDIAKHCDTKGIPNVIKTSSCNNNE